MIDFLGSGVLGGVLGGLMRLGVEWFKFKDRDNERKHELAMVDKQLEFQKLTGQQKMDEMRIDQQTQISLGELSALGEAIRSQTEMVKIAGGWVASLSASVRPVITYWIFGLYAAVKTSLIVAAFLESGEVTTALRLSWTPDDLGVLMLILGFWFVGRSAEKK